MKKLMMITTAAMLIAGASMAQDKPEISIAVGQQGRGYESFGIKMAERMSDAYTVEIKNYEGSDAISRAVARKEAEVGIVQIDAIYTRSLEKTSFKVAGTYGKEFVYMMVPPDSDIGQLSDMTKEHTIQVDTKGSGTDLFWNTAVSIEVGPDGNKSSWASATAYHDVASLAATNAEIGTIDAVIFVAKNDSKDVKALFDAGWTLVDFYDKDLNDKMFNKESLYPVADAEIAGTSGMFGGNESASSYEVRSFIVINTEAAKDSNLVREVARVVPMVQNETKKN